MSISSLETLSISRAMSWQCHVFTLRNTLEEFKKDKNFTAVESELYNCLYDYDQKFENATSKPSVEAFSRWNQTVSRYSFGGS